ncbi:kelch repeat-containing protein [Roseivirga sp. BDSF3-8]|uniref:kelch repeat-containing protein n=1 Tax=Roseivirga sp. BDSF3-8 TaxID=3241598 RepID=UPI0035318C61
MKALPFLLVLFLLIACAENTEEQEVKTPPSPLPVATTNGAVTAFESEGMQQVYVFGGLGKEKDYKGITRRSFRYDLEDGRWAELPPLPDTLGKIAAAASQIGDKLYIAGGYHVFADGHERSSN